MKHGTLVDATIITAAVKPPAFEEGHVNPRDPDASFTKKNGEIYFGYKAHLAVDEESGVVRQAEMTSADLHDSQRGLAMIQGDEEAYYGDKAYDGQAHRRDSGHAGKAQFGRSRRRQIPAIFVFESSLRSAPEHLNECAEREAR